MRVLHTESQVSFNQPGTFFRSDNLFRSETLHPDMPRIVHDTLELLHRLQEFHDRVPVRDFLGKDIATAQGTEITATSGTFACGLCQIQEAAVSEIRAFVEMTLIAAGQETFRPVSFAPVVFLDEPVLLVHDRIIGKHLHGLYPGTVNGFIFRRRHRVQFRQLDLEGYRNVRILAYDAVVFHGQNRESVFQITGLQYTSHFFLFFLVNALNILRRADR